MVKDSKNKNNSSNSLVFGRWPQTKISFIKLGDLVISWSPHDKQVLGSIPAIINNFYPKHCHSKIYCVSLIRKKTALVWLSGVTTSLNWHVQGTNLLHQSTYWHTYWTS